MPVPKPRPRISRIVVVYYAKKSRNQGTASIAVQLAFTTPGKTRLIHATKTSTFLPRTESSGRPDPRLSEVLLVNYRACVAWPLHCTVPLRLACARRLRQALARNNICPLQSRGNATLKRSPATKALLLTVINKASLVNATAETQPPY